MGLIRRAYQTSNRLCRDEKNRWASAVYIRVRGLRMDMSLPDCDKSEHDDDNDNDEHESLIIQHAQRLLDALSAKVLCKAATMLPGQQPKVHFSAAELVSSLGQLLGENASKAGTAEHAVCGVVENMKMDGEGMCRLLLEEAAVLVPVRMRPCSSDIIDALSRSWLRLRDMVLSRDHDVGALCVFVCQCPHF
jgi:hypothetical protein